MQQLSYYVSLILGTYKTLDILCSPCLVCMTIVPLPLGSTVLSCPNHLRLDRFVDLAKKIDIFSHVDRAASVNKSRG